ncbi:MAG: hypothetical protein AAGA78_03400 [Pseudomonadota bacterium]
MKALSLIAAAAVTLASVPAFAGTSGDLELKNMRDAAFIILPSGRADEDDFEGQRFGFEMNDADGQLSNFAPDFSIDEGGEN